MVNRSRRLYWPRFLGSLCVILFVLLVSVRTPLHTNKETSDLEEILEYSSSVIFEELPIPIVSSQSIVPNAPSKPYVQPQVQGLDPEKEFSLDLQGLELTAGPFQGRIALQPDTPVRVLTIVEPTFETLSYPQSWRGKTIQVRILIGLEGQVLHSTLLTDSLPDRQINESLIQNIEQEINGALSEWVFRPAQDRGEVVLSYTTQTFRLR